jgi:hypothetical protein
MKRAILSMTMLWVVASGVDAQVEVPQEVADSAVAAVKAMGDQVVLGKHQVAIDRMYPQWKESVAKREGGMAKLEAKLAGIVKQMNAQGVQLISFRPEGEPTAYEVGPGKEVVEEGGRKVEKMIYKQWMLLIPTLTEYRIAKPEKSGDLPEFLVIASRGFQVAISDKGKNDWTFIDGAGVTVPELRRLFITLPDTMVLPEIKREHKDAKP